MALSMESKAEEVTANPHAIRWWEILLVPVGGFIVWFGLLIAIGMGAGLVGVKLGYSPDNIRAWVEQFKASPLLIWIVLAALYFGFLIVLGFALRGRRQILVANFSRDANPGQIQAAIVCGILIAVGVVMGVSYLDSHHIVTFHEMPSEKQLMPHSFPELLLVLAVIAMLGPFVEELFFRGMMLTWLQQSLPPAAAALISAVIFSLCHGHLIVRPGAEGWVLSGVIVLVGLINAIWAQRTRSLWPPLALHAAYNGTYVLAQYFLS